MICPNCGLDRCNVQILQDEIKTKTKKKGLLHGIGRATMIAGTGGLWAMTPKQKETSKSTMQTHKEVICQNCGHSWEI